MLSGVYRHEGAEEHMSHCLGLLEVLRSPAETVGSERFWFPIHYAFLSTMQASSNTTPQRADCMRIRPSASVSSAPYRRSQKLSSPNHLRGLAFNGLRHCDPLVSAPSSKFSISIINPKRLVGNLGSPAHRILKLRAAMIDESVKRSASDFRG